MTNHSTELSDNIKFWGRQLGFSLVGITSAEPLTDEEKMRVWLAEGCHGEMSYLAANVAKRFNPNELVPGVKSIICCALNYYHPDSSPHIARYALGHDYHEVMRALLKELAEKINREVGIFNYRCFVDSAPVAEKAMALRAGLGWRGKNTLVINAGFGSWLFLGEIYTDLNLAFDKLQADLCGDCDACIKACPTKALLAPYKIDARRCLAYLTIEHKSDVPEEFGSLVGQCVYGCDICQNACPWNKKTKTTNISDFFPGKKLTKATLSELANWTETEFKENTKNSAISRIGFQRWQRNISLALKAK